MDCSLLDCLLIVFLIAYGLSFYLLMDCFLDGLQTYFLFAFFVLIAYKCLMGRFFVILLFANWLSSSLLDD